MDIANYHPQFIDLVKTWLEFPGFPDSLKPITIAQWIEESGRGNSSAARECLNFAGLFWREALRYVDGAKKIRRQLPSETTVKWFTQFDSLSSFCQGYITFINRSHYKGWQKYTNNPRGYLDHLQGHRGRNKRVAPYCAKPGYQNRVMSLLPEAQALISHVQGHYHEAKHVAKNSLVVGIDAGHGRPPDTGAGGENSYLNEEVECQNVALELKQIIESAGHRVVMLRPDRVSSVRDSLSQRVKRANREPGMNLFVSIHFNAFRKVAKAMGTEVFVASNASRASKTYAAQIQQQLVDTLNLPNRKVKSAPLYVCRATICPAVLVEVCFIDSESDADRYKEVGHRKVAEAIARGIGVSTARPAGIAEAPKPKPVVQFTVQNMVKYYTGLTHQDEALDLVQHLLNKNPDILEKVTQVYRNER